MEAQPVDYAVMIATLLAISLAGERIVAILKNLIPGLQEPPPAEPASVTTDRPQDRWRRLGVQTVAFLACWLAAASLNKFNFIAPIDIAGLELAPAVVGFLAMGGSAFWSQMLGISSALKDLKKVQVENARTGTAAQDPPSLAEKRGLKPGDQFDGVEKVVGSRT